MTRGLKYGREEKEEQDRYAKLELHVGLKDSMRRNKNETKMTLFSSNGNRGTTKERKTAWITERQ